jgi:transposase
MNEDRENEAGELVPQAHGGALYEGRPPGYLNPNAGRPTKLTPELFSAIVDAIRSGNYAQVAAATAGITEQTFYEWLRRGRDEPDGIYRRFADAVLAASGEAEQEKLERLRREALADDGDWKAAAWWLERRFPKRWGKQQRLEIVTPPELDTEW